MPKPPRSQTSADPLLRSGLSLSDVLFYLGYEHQPSSSPGKRYIIKATPQRREVVFTGFHHEVWTWLRATGQYPGPSRCDCGACDAIRASEVAA